MDLNNPWVGYADRSYDQIRSKLIGNLPPELQGLPEADPLMILLDMYAGVAEMLGYYIDSHARESFLNTAEMYKSVLDIIKVLDYRVKANTPETVDVTFTLNEPAPVGGIVIPISTSITNGGYPFITTSMGVIAEGDTEVTIGCHQVVNVFDLNLAQSNGLENQEVLLGKDYMQGTAKAVIGGEQYILVNTFAYSSPTDRHFIVNITPDLNAVAIFGDGLRGMIPPPHVDIRFSFKQTEGPRGRVRAGELTVITSSIPLPPTYSIECNNIGDSAGGSFVQSLEEIRRDAPLFVRHREAAVTDIDLEDIMMSYPGVLHAKVINRCLRPLPIAIAPQAGIEGAIASQSLLEELKHYIEDKRMYGTVIQPQTTGLRYIKMTVEVTARYRVDLAELEAQVRSALIAQYNYPSASIGRGIYISDLYALIDNLPKVDYANLLSLQLYPYAQPHNHVVQLVWDIINVFPYKGDPIKYVVGYFNTYYTISRGSIFQGVIQVGDGYTDEYISIIFNDTPEAETGRTWEFQINSTDGDITDIGNTIPVLTSDNLSIITKDSETWQRQH